MNASALTPAECIDHASALCDATREAETVPVPDAQVAQWLEQLGAIHQGLAPTAWHGLVELDALRTDLEAILNSTLEFEGLVAGAFADRMDAWVQQLIEEGPTLTGGPNDTAQDSGPAAECDDEASSDDDLVVAIQELSAYFVTAQNGEPDADTRARAFGQLQALAEGVGRLGHTDLADLLHGIAEDVQTIEDSPVPLDGIVAESISDRFDPLVTDLLNTVQGGVPTDEGVNIDTVLDQASMALMLLEEGAGPDALSDAVARVDDLHALLLETAPAALSTLVLGLKAHLSTRVVSDAAVEATEIAAVQAILDAVHTGLGDARASRDVQVDADALLGALAGEGVVPDAPAATTDADVSTLIQVLQGADNPKMLLAFMEDVRSQVETLEAVTLDWEKNSEDGELLRAIFRSVHTIKGDAGMIGYPLLNHVFHSLENILSRLREGTIRFRPAYAQLVLESTDLLNRLLADLEEALSLESLNGWLPSVQDADLHRMLEGIEQAGALEAEAEKPLGELLVNEGIVTSAQVDAALAEQQRSIGEVLVEEKVATPGQVDQALEKQQALRQSAGVQDTIKVNLERLDTLIDLVGELSIAQTMLVTQRATGATGDAFDKVLDQFGKLTEDIQDRAMAMRMVPIKPLFQKMQRLVRDLGRKSGKDVALRVRGEETEIDKTVVEELGDPLVHLVRNAMDHGLESPADREAAGKPASGEVRLEAYHAAGHIVIELADDGRGIDGARVRAKAEERGLVEPGATLSESQTHQLLFLPGFSTATQVTELSGRGVGMDVVKRNIERLRGRVDVQSVAGQGTTFTIKLPLTLAIIDGMIVQVGREQYVIPLVNIVQSVRPQRAQVQTVQGRGEYVQVRGELVPLVRLHTVFGTGGTMPAPWEALVVVVMTEDGRQGALVVDELLGQQQVVVKTLGPAFRQVRGLSGASIMGDGQVALILDVTTLLDYARAA